MLSPYSNNVAPLASETPNLIPPSFFLGFLCYYLFLLFALEAIKREIPFAGAYSLHWVFILGLNH
jgi:hypothetical protein